MKVVVTDYLDGPQEYQNARVAITTDGDLWVDKSDNDDSLAEYPAGSWSKIEVTA